MLLVVFGAGSSFDSVPQLPPGPPIEGMAHWQELPPLANQLFDTRQIFVELMEKFKDFQPLVPILRQSGSSVEKKLAEFQEQAKNVPTGTPRTSCDSLLSPFRIVNLPKYVAYQAPGRHQLCDVTS